MFKCPSCGGSISRAHIPCVRCGHVFIPDSPARRRVDPFGRLSAWNGWIPALILGFMAMASCPLINEPCGRRSTPERDAYGTCHTYVSAQVMYGRTDWDGDGKLTYAPQLALLSTTPDDSGQPVQLIDDAFAAATSPETAKRGYVFREMSTIAGKPIDWEKDFGLCAVPAEYGPATKQTFIVCTNGTVFGRDAGASEFVSDFPSDPNAEGWTCDEPPARSRSFLEQNAEMAATAFGAAVFLATWIGAAVYAAWSDRRKGPGY